MSDRFDDLVGDIETPRSGIACGACTSYCSRSRRRPSCPPRTSRRPVASAGRACRSAAGTRWR